MGRPKRRQAEARLEREIKRLEAFHPPPAGRSRPRGPSALCFRCTFRLAAPRAKKSTRGVAPRSRHQRAHFNSTRRQRHVGILAKLLQRSLPRHRGRHLRPVPDEVPGSGRIGQPLAPHGSHCLTQLGISFARRFEVGEELAHRRIGAMSANMSSRSASFSCPAKAPPAEIAASRAS